MERALMCVASSLSIMVAPTMNCPGPRGTTYSGVRGCSTRTGRLSDSSGSRSSSISPFTPRRPGRCARAARPVQSMSRPAAVALPASVPKRMLTPSVRSRAASACRAARGSRWPSSGKYSPCAKRPPSSASSAAICSPPTRWYCAVRCANWPSSPKSRACATTSVPRATVPAKCSRHQPRLSPPSVAISGSDASRSHHGASMPPANHEQPAPSRAAARSSTCTLTPRSASSTAQTSPATPAPMTVTCTASALLRRRARHVQLAAAGAKPGGHFGHAGCARLGAHLVRDAHGAELRAAHRAEVRHLVALLGQRGVVEGAGGIRIERQVELVLPAEIEACARQRVIARACPGVSLGQVRGMRRDLVGDDPGLDVVAVGESEVLLGSDVTEHGGAVPTDHRRADRRGDVIVAGRDVGRERAERVERRLAAGGQLLVHVLLDLVHGHVARALDHHLAILPPGDAG